MMAQIFVSHSQKDTKLLDFLNKAFASSNVQAKYEEIELLSHGRRTSDQISADISLSNAIFVVLGKNVETLKHTRDWVAWESGIAHAKNKDVWVIEALEDSPKLSVVIPRVQHYLCFNYTDPWLSYLREIVTSYDDSHVLKAVAAGAAVGGMLSESAGGALLGGGVGLLAAINAQTRPSGLPVSCPACNSFYKVHIASMSMRCPVCNTRLIFPK
jgi:hypothetical protein